MLGNQKSKTPPSIGGLFYIPRVTRDNGIFVTDAEGYIFSEFFKILAEENEKPLPPALLEYPDEAINEYIQNYGLVVVLRDPDGSKICYSLDYTNKLPVAFTDLIRRQFQLMPKDTVLWSDDVSVDPKEYPARQVIYGQRPERPPGNPSKAQTRKEWAHPAALSSDEMDYLSGKSPEPPKK